MSLFDRFREIADRPVPPPRTWQGRPGFQERHWPQFEGTHTQDQVASPIQRQKPILQDGFVTRLVAQTDAIPARTRSGGNHEGYLHVSSLIGMCEREHTISAQHGVPTFKSVSGPMKIIWAIGRAVEKHIRDAVIGARMWIGVFGKWHCRCGASTHVGLHPKDRTCPRCDQPLRSYGEPLLIDHDYGVVGSPDLTLVEMGFYLVVEIKSMNKDQFDRIEAPLADHILQALSYRHLYIRAGYPVLDVVSIVYGRKDFKFGGSRSVYKEYHVEAAPWQGQINQMFEAALRVKRANETGDLLPRICERIDCTRAKECERATLCFSM